MKLFSLNADDYRETHYKCGSITKPSLLPARFVGVNSVKGRGSWEGQQDVARALPQASGVKTLVSTPGSVL